MRRFLGLIAACLIAPSIAFAAMDATVPADNEAIGLGASRIREVKTYILRNYVDVVDKGADSTGATDSTTAVQAALNAVTSGAKIFFPSGTYLFNISQITMPAVSNLIFEGQGPGNTILKFGNFGAGISAFKLANSTNHITIRNLTMQGLANDDTAPDGLIELDNNVDDVLIENVELFYAGMSAIRVSSTAGNAPERLTIQNFYIHHIATATMTSTTGGAGGIAIGGAGAVDVKVLHGRLEEIGRAAIATTMHSLYVQTTTNLTVQDARITGNPYGNFQIGQSTAGGGVTGLVFVGNKITNTNMNYFLGVKGIVANNDFTIGTNPEAAAVRFYYATDVTDVNVVGNTFHLGDNPKNVFDVLLGAADTISFIGNKAYSTNATAAGTGLMFNVAYYVAGANNISIVGNQSIGMPRFLSVATGANGTVRGNLAVNTVATGSYLVGFTTSDSAPTGWVIDGNTFVAHASQYMFYDLALGQNSFKNNHITNGSLNNVPKQIQRLSWNATATVADGGTITHSLGTTPSAVIATPSVAGEMVSVTALAATTFTVAIKKNDGSAGTTQTIYWQALK